jgi:O-antigen/teichoic acid export membrane protein
LAVLISLDFVVGGLVLGTDRQLVTYEAANILGRLPVFVGGAVSVVVFPLLSAPWANITEETRERLWPFVRASTCCSTYLRLTMT